MFTRTALRTAGVAKIAARNISRTAPLRSASGHAPSKPPSSDVPWIIGSIAFTIPAAAYLLNSGSAPAHAKDDAHHAAEAVKESVPEPEAAAESVKAASASVTEKVKETAHDAAAKVGETIPAAKKVLPAGAADEAPEGRSAEDPAVRDPAATAKDVDRDVTSGRMSDKQEGLSNADTSNAVLQTERGDALSKKGDGQHETAKLKGTVDVNSEDKKVERNDDEHKEAESKPAEEKKEEKKEGSSA